MGKKVNQAATRSLEFGKFRVEPLTRASYRRGDFGSLMAHCVLIGLMFGLVSIVISDRVNTEGMDITQSLEAKADILLGLIPFAFCALMASVIWHFGAKIGAVMIAGVAVMVALAVQVYMTYA